MSTLSVQQLESVKAALSTTIQSRETTTDSQPRDITPFLSQFYDQQTNRISLIQVDSIGIIAFIDAKTHIFPSKKKKFFVTVIAPSSKAGVYALTFANADNLSQSFSITDEIKVEYSTFPKFLEPLEIESTSAVLLPVRDSSLLFESIFADKIEPSILAQHLQENNEDCSRLDRVIEFLLQCSLKVVREHKFSLSTPSLQGKETWQKMLLELPVQSHDQANANSEDESEAIPIDNESDIQLSSDSESDVPTNKRRRTSTADSLQMLPWIKEIQALNSTLVNHIMTSANAPNLNHSVLSLDDKSCWLKKMPEVAKGLLIHLRAGPNNPSPSNLSVEMETFLKGCSSKQQAEIQLPAFISKFTQSRFFDCMVSGQELENWFKIGDVKQAHLVNNFAKAYGLNFHAMGPKSTILEPITATSPSGLKNKVFIPGHFSELEDSAINLLALVSVISGDGNDSFAKLGLEKLIQFYKRYKADIKQLCEVKANLLADIQMQLGNEWNSFLVDVTQRHATKEPDFEFVTKQIERGKPPIPILPDDFQVSSSSFTTNGKARKPFQPPPVDRDHTPLPNSHPQLKIGGNSDTERTEAFRAKFKRNLLPSFKLPKVDKNGKPKADGNYVCLAFHLLHSCPRRNQCKFFHGRLDDESVNQILTKSREHHLGISKL